VIAFILSRMLQGALALFFLSLVVFLTTRASGDPLHILLPPEATREDYARLARELGLDQPLPVQYVRYIGDLATGDFGKSLRSGEPVLTLLLQRVPASLHLAATAFGLIVLLGIPLGVAAALGRGSMVDTAVKIVALIGQSAPSFWLGIVLIEVFAVSLRWLPAGTNQGALNVILPAISLAGFGIAAVTRLLRSSMLEVLDSEFVKFARAKGVPERMVIGKHALRNALLPVVSFLGVLTVGLITLAITTETVFAWPGLGLLTYSAILNRDFPVVQGVTLFAGAMSILIGLLGDMLVVFLDPRIRVSGN
jgi:peptide/nickel transport system permease protein